MLLMVMNSCERDVKNVGLPEFEQKLVLAAFISPSDTISKITVSSNQRIYGELGTRVTAGNLSGTISNGSYEAALEPTDNGLKFDNKKMPVEYGKTYTLKVFSDKGLSAEAVCRVPEKKNFTLSADTFSVQMNYGWGMEERRIDVNFRIMDIPGEENFYRIKGTGMGYLRYVNNGSVYRYTDKLRFERDLFSDRGMDGKEIVHKTDYGLNYFYEADSAFVVLYIFNTGKSYFQYHKSLYDFSGGDTPFSEVTPVFSNVTGGLGIFAAYTIDSIVLRLK